MANEIMITVDGVAMPCPSTFIYGLQDVSSGESGRDDTGYMFKNRITQKVKIQLGWNALQWSEVASIMQAFDPEYVMTPLAGEFAAIEPIATNEAPSPVFTRLSAKPFAMNRGT